MKINTNISSMRALNSLEKTSKALSRSLERLATGKRINSARDDAAGLAIATGLESQVRGNAEIVKGLNQASSYLGVADGSLQELAQIANRMKEIALQAANGTLNTSDRAYLNSEFQSLRSEVDRLSVQANFNGKNLFDGSSSSLLLTTSTNGSNSNLNLELPTLSASKIFSKQKTVGLGTFEAITTFARSNAHVSPMATGDFNEDGLDDVIMSSGPTLHLSNGDGTFRQVSMSVPSGASSWRVGAAVNDFNEDGHLDFAELGSNTVNLYFGNGAGGFSRSTTFATDSNSTAGYHHEMLKSADLNGDGHQDLVVLSRTSQTASIYLGSGSGSFSLSQTLSVVVGSDSNSMMPIDIDRDGDMDLVFNQGGHPNDALIYKNDSYGRFSAGSSLTIDYGNNMRKGDFNGDGYEDLVFGDFAGAVSLFYGSASGISDNRVVLNLSSPSPFNNGDVDVADFDQDGYDDLVFFPAGSLNRLQVFKGGASGLSTSRSSYVQTGFNNYLPALADYNGDGFMDIGGGSLDFFTAMQKTAESTVFADLNISTQESAEDVLEFLDAGIENLSSYRADLGAQLNRLQFAESNTSKMLESLASARSQIMDSDVAAETAELTRNQILQQAGVAVLGQANAQMQTVLALLGALR